MTAKKKTTTKKTKPKGTTLTQRLVAAAVTRTRRQERDRHRNSPVQAVAEVARASDIDREHRMRALVADALGSVTARLDAIPDRIEDIVARAVVTVVNEMRLASGREMLASDATPSPTERFHAEDAEDERNERARERHREAVSLTPHSESADPPIR